MTKYFLTWILSITVTTVCLCQTILVGAQILSCARYRKQKIALRNKDTILFIVLQDFWYLGRLYKSLFFEYFNHQLSERY